MIIFDLILFILFFCTLTEIGINQESNEEMKSWISVRWFHHQSLFNFCWCWIKEWMRIDSNVCNGLKIKLRKYHIDFHREPNYYKLLKLKDSTQLVVTWEWEYYSFLNLTAEFIKTSNWDSNVSGIIWKSTEWWNDFL